MRFKKCVKYARQEKKVQFQKISILAPQKGLKFPGGWGVL